MKIVDRKTFLNLPDGVIYAKYHNNHYDPDFGAISIKLNSKDYGNDWVYMDLFSLDDWEDSEEIEEKIKLMEAGQSFPLKLDSGARDGLYEDNQKFVIYEKQDLIKLRNLFTESINGL